MRENKPGPGSPVRSGEGMTTSGMWRLAALLAISTAAAPAAALAQQEQPAAPQLTFPGQPGQADPAQDDKIVQPPAQEKPEERIKNPVAEFTGIDKITGRIISFDVYMDETVQFGALQVTPRICYSSAKSGEPKTDAFVEVDEITLDRKIRRIFTGWMFAESPGLNAVEHAVYDVWLKACKASSEVPPPKSAQAG